MKHAIVTLLVLLGLALHAFAADDPSIKGDKRSAIQAAMQRHIEHNTVDGHYVLYDAVTDELLKLKLDKLHDGIVKKADYYVSCADFHDADGTYFDLDFLVVEENGAFRTLQGVVHKVENTKRAYHLED